MAGETAQKRPVSVTAAIFLLWTDVLIGAVTGMGVGVSWIALDGLAYYVALVVAYVALMILIRNVTQRAN